MVVVALLALVAGGLILATRLSGDRPEAASSSSGTATPSSSSTARGSASTSSSGGSSSAAPKGSADGGAAGKRDAELREQVEQRLQESLEEDDTVFRVASFNLLGASHTGPKGNKPAWRSARTAPRTRAELAALEAEQVSVAGLQEFEPPQLRAFGRAAGGRWSVYPGGSRGARATANSIAWRTDTWSLVQHHTLTIPYFHGMPWPMPYVKLRHAGTGAQIWFLNVHNPANTPRWGNNARWRRVAVQRELQLVRRLSADAPVVMTGDFNERAQVLCQVQRSGLMRLAGGGAGCAPPRGSSVDWIFGTDRVDLSQAAWKWTGRISDHPMALATAVVRGE